MFSVYIILCSFLLLQRTGAEGESQSEDSRGLPAWLAENPAFQHPEEIDSKKSGEGSIGAAGKGNLGWLAHCNDKTGYGIEVELTLSLDPDSEEFLMVAPWPLTAPITQIKLFSGRFQKPPKRLRIPNTKSFQVVYAASRESSEMTLKYRRYGASLEVSPPPTDDPVKIKEIIFEVQLRGKPPTEYALPDFSTRFKTALRSVARRYANAHHIPFNDSIPTHQMVLLHRVSFCPFEWPERDICASVEHSIFISGVPVSDENFIKNYQLTADHLEIMWSGGNFPELAEMGISVFLLPRMSRTVLYWSLIVVFMVAFSLAGSFLFWRSNNVAEDRSRQCSTGRGVRKARRSKLRLGKQQRIPSFMHADGPELGEPSSRNAKEEVYLRERFRGVSTPENSSELPIKNYFGSILFGSNRAFEDDEDNPLELRPSSPIK